MIAVAFVRSCDLAHSVQRLGCVGQIPAAWTPPCLSLRRVVHSPHLFVVSSPALETYFPLALRMVTTPLGITRGCATLLHAPLSIATRIFTAALPVSMKRLRGFSRSMQKCPNRNQGSADPVLVNEKPGFEVLAHELFVEYGLDFCDTCTDLVSHS